MATVSIQEAANADLKKRLNPLFNPPRDPVLVEIPELNFILIDGDGPPPDSDTQPNPGFQARIQAIYSTAYTLKFRLKRDGIAVPILPLEAIWWGAGGSFDMHTPKAEWRWRMLMVVPDEVTPEVFAEVQAEVRRKRPDSIEGLRLERWCEGLVAQVMHVGPYSAEEPTIERLHAFIAEQGLRLRGAHHEIYLGDPRTSDPAKLRTAIRQPVA